MKLKILISRDRMYWIMKSKISRIKCPKKFIRSRKMPSIEVVRKERKNNYKKLQFMVDHYLYFSL